MIISTGVGGAGTRSPSGAGVGGNCNVQPGLGADAVLGGGYPPRLLPCLLKRPVWKAIYKAQDKFDSLLYWNHNPGMINTLYIWNNDLI
jgi:hypothetical protein